MKAFRVVGCAALLMLFASGTIAAERSQPCTTAPGYDAFDFWLGTWVVHVADGSVAGHNRITRSADGCRIDEAWRSAAGGTGRSINFHDPADGAWEQVWHSPDGTFIRIRGGVDDDGMLLVGLIHYLEQDQSARFRGRWTPLADGRVRQFFEQYSGETETWQPWFEGFHTRIPDSEMPL